MGNFDHLTEGVEAPDIKKLHEAAGSFNIYFFYLTRNSYINTNTLGSFNEEESLAIFAALSLPEDQEMRDLLLVQIFEGKQKKIVSEKAFKALQHYSKREVFADSMAKALRETNNEIKKVLTGNANA